MPTQIKSPGYAGALKLLAVPLFLLGGIILLAVAYLAYVDLKHLGFCGIATPILLALGLIWTATALWRRAREVRRVQHGQCTHCGYNRQGLTIPTPCPECSQ